MKNISVGIISSFLALVGTVADYFFDTQLIFSSYDSWNAITEKEFPLKNWLYGIFVFLAFTISASHIINSCHLWSKKHFHTETLREKACYGISIVTFPIFYLASHFLYMVKKWIHPDENLEDYMNSEIIMYQFQKTINEQKIVEGCIENILQLIMLLLIALSTPLKDKINPIFGLEFFFVKSGLALFLICRKIGDFLNFQCDEKTEFVGRLVLSISYLFFMISRILSFIFCLMFSTVFPDLPYFLFYVSKLVKEDSTYHSNKVYERTPPNSMNVATPRSLKILQSITISNITAVTCIILITISSLICIALMLYFRKTTTKKPGLKIILITALINMFCPVVPTTKSTFKMNAKMSEAKQYKILIMMFITTNTILATIPFLVYGLDFYQVKLEILDEFIRYGSFLFRTDVLPVNFPTSLPQVFLKGHIIFPTCIGVTMILGIVSQFVYQTYFQPWGTVTLKKQAENEKEKENKDRSEMELQELSSTSREFDLETDFASKK